MSNINTVTAQPVFSDDEMAALFRALGVKGDVHNEADCERAMTELNAALSDPDRERSVSAVLTDIASEAGGTDTLISEGPVTAIRLAPNAGGGFEFLDDEPTRGRVLNWTAKQRGSVLKAADHWTAVGVSGGYTVLSGGNTSWRPDWKERSDESAPLEAFIARAGESLPDTHTSFFVQMFKSLLSPDERVPRNVKWRTDDDFVNVAVRHGARTWEVKLQILETAILLLVMKNQQTVVEREVARSSPEDFSRTLLRALDGDVTSTHLTLDAVQQAASADPHALH